MKANFYVSIIFVLILSSCNQKHTNSDPELVKVVPFSYCSIEMQGPWNQFNAAVKILDEEILKQNISTHGELISVWRSYPETTKEADYKWEVGYKLTDPIAVNGPLVIKTWETTNLYKQHYDGPANGVTEFFKNYWKWFDDNELKVVRPLLEITYPETEVGDNQSKFEVLVKAIKNDI